MDIDGENPSDQSGSAISINGDGTIVAIGGPSHDSPNGANSGHVRVYSYNGTNWDQLGLDIIGDFPNDQHGNSVSINSNGTRVAIGALRNDSNGTNSGYVRIYEYNGD